MKMHIKYLIKYNIAFKTVHYIEVMILTYD